MSTKIITTVLDTAYTLTLLIVLLALAYFFSELWANTIIKSKNK